MVTIQREMLCTVAMDVDALLQLHYEELCSHKDRKALAPRWDAYGALERQGKLLVLAARDDGKLVGYAAFFMDAHMHYAGYRMATNDVLFLHREHRRGTLGLRLIDRGEEEARAAGCDHVLWRAKPDTILFKILSRRKGYAPEETTFGKPLHKD